MYKATLAQKPPHYNFPGGGRREQSSWERIVAEHARNADFLIYSADGLVTANKTVHLPDMVLGDSILRPEIYMKIFLYS